MRESLEINFNIPTLLTTSQYQKLVVGNKYLTCIMNLERSLALIQQNQSKNSPQGPTHKLSQEFYKKPMETSQNQPKFFENEDPFRNGCCMLEN